MYNITSYPFICKICGRSSEEAKLDCNENDFCICSEGHGCREFEDIFKNIYADLYINGKLCQPRKEKTLEIENFNFVFPPYARFCNFDIRNLKVDYIKKEFLWYLKGDPYDTSITAHAKMWKNFINENGVIQSNYGAYIFGEMNQFDNVAEILKKDPASRRAIIMILQPYHLLYKWKEVPCTYGINFLIRENKLNISVKMRSQDAYLGFGSDIPIFSFIHEMMYIVLKEEFPTLEIGNYHHFVDSFHIYKNHFDFLDKIVQNNYRYKKIDCPRISSKKEVDFLTKAKERSFISEEYKFTQWLMNFNQNGYNINRGEINNGQTFINV